MRKITYFCDRCKQETDEPQALAIHTIIPEAEDGGNSYVNSFDKHFCPKCMEEVNVAIEGILEWEAAGRPQPKDTQEAEDQETPEEIKATIPAGPELDHTKAITFYNAGWTIASIADEMNTDTKTIKKILREYNQANDQTA